MHDTHTSTVGSPTAAQIIGCAPRTLPNWRAQGRGPRFIRVGRLIRYRIADLEEYLASRIVETRQPMTRQADDQRLREVIAELRKVHAEIHRCGNFDSMPKELGEECGRLWNEHNLLQGRLGDDS
jgi:hypothetical protein